ncbi:ROK family protein [Streptomyces sp. XM4193]|uniref:ROK family transcriptional regulator n=1 Tax=Streptomyces sp. XM4193 TaxID=2929782 RepID=UPI001FF726FF|nr:ROK family transcriptional regulator [Streptomyces sp. XM4193]MCK1798122.1 ROK family protein [Streptomyces sp. XM4193]
MAVAPRLHTQQDMRRRNLAAVLYAVADAGPASRASVAARIGLTRAAVSTLVDELLTAALLEEQGPGRSGTVGRPGTVLGLSERGPCGVGAEIGVDHLAVCAVDLRGRVRARTAVDAANRESSPELVLRRLAELTARLAKDTAAQGLRPAGVCVAVPGLVARRTTRVVRAPNLGWQDVELAPWFAELDRELGLSAAQRRTPYFFVDNEAHLGARAEVWTEPPGDGEDEGPDGAAPRSASAQEAAAPGTSQETPGEILHVSAEVGIGAAVLVDGELLRGSRGFAGELGHVPVRRRGRPCGCGRNGCLEQYAGEEAVLRAVGLDPARALAEHPGPGGRVEMLARRAEDGDRQVLRALRAAGGDLGVALSGAASLLDPRTIVLGGAMARLAPWLLPPLEEELARGPAGGSVVAVARLGADGPLLGAAHAVVRAVLDDPLGTATRRPLLAEES